MSKLLSQRQLLLLPLLTVASLVVPGLSSLPAASVGLPDAPDAEELCMMAQLSSWVQGDEARPGVALVIRARRDSFEVFRNFAGEAERRSVLESLPFGDTIGLVASEQHLDPLLLVAMVAAESSFDPTVVSRRGAQGLMQLMPGTIAELGIGDPMDPASNLRAGARYLRSLLDRYEGDLELAVAAYNAGPGNVARFGGVPPFPETRRYVERVLGEYVQLHRSAWLAQDVGELLAKSWSPQEASDGFDGIG